MDRWWNEIESAVRDALHERDELSVTEVAAHLDVSETAAASLLGVLAADGRIRIVTVAGPTRRDLTPPTTAAGAGRASGSAGSSGT
jgi:hypothetical protein